MATTKSVHLGKKDALLIEWKRKVTEKDEFGLLSFLVRQALLSYLHTGNFVCVGKIQFNIIKNTSSDIITLQRSYADAPEIDQWLSHPTQSGIKHSKLIRHILKNSIQVVETPEEEYIPNFYDFETISFQHHMNSYPAAWSAPNASTVQNTQPVTADTNVQPDVQSTPPQKDTITVQPVTQKKTVGNVAALFSEDDW